MKVAPSSLDEFINQLKAAEHSGIYLNQIQADNNPLSPAANFSIGGADSDEEEEKVCFEQEDVPINSS